MIRQIPVVAVVTALLTLSRGVSATPEYDPPVVIESYDVEARAGFEANRVEVSVRAALTNPGAEPLDRIDFDLCSTSGMREIRVRDFQVERLSTTASVPLMLEPRTMGNGGTLYSLELDSPLLPGAATTLAFSYVLQGRSASSLPMHHASVGELYLIPDFGWLPTPYAQVRAGQFARAHRPTWRLRVRYPSPLVAETDGRLVERARDGTMTVDTWESAIGGWPSLFVGPYQIHSRQQGDFTLQVFAPEGGDLPIDLSSLQDGALQMLDIYTELYGHPGSDTYRIVVTHTEGGGHAQYMGQAVSGSLLRQQGLEGVAHEMAHTWWGEIVSSYGDGSKFLRESLASFSAAWALRQIEGQEHFDNILRDYRIRAFCKYPAASTPQEQYPLVQQDGFPVPGVVEATYLRGPLFLNALRGEMGSESLFGALRAFAGEFHGDSATLTDFTESLGRASGRDLEPLFQKACWGTAYPSYQVVGTRTEGHATHVAIRNLGDVAFPCPVRLSSASGERTELVTVKEGEQAEFVFAAGSAAPTVALDPDGTAYQYHPDQRFALWKGLDRDQLGGRNWHHYNQSYAYYATGEIDTAVEVLSEYFARAYESPLPDRDRARRDPVLGSYLFSAGFYYLALGDGDRARHCFLGAVPTLAKCLSDDLSMRVYSLAGFVPGPDREARVAAMLDELTNHRFSPASDGALQLEQLLSWCAEEDAEARLELEGMRRFAPVSYPTAVREQMHPVASPATTSLLQNYPNPFNSRTSIDFRLNAPGRVRLDLFNAAGQRVKTLLNEVRSAGDHTVRWSGRDDQGGEAASGVYLYLLTTERQRHARTLVLVQ